MLQIPWNGQDYCVRMFAWHCLISAFILAVSAAICGAACANSSVELLTSDRVRVVTDSHDVVFSLRGAVPVSWRIATRSASPNNNVESSVVVIDPQVPEGGQAQFFEFAPTAPNDPGLGLLNQSKFTLEHSTVDAYVQLRFRAPEAIPPGLAVTKIFNIPLSGYGASFSLEIENNSADLVRLDRENLLLGLSLSMLFGEPEPTLGKPSTSVSLLTDGAVESFSSGLIDDDVQDLLKSVRSPSWVALHDRFFIFAIVCITTTDNKCAYTLEANRLNSDNSASPDDQDRRLEASTLELIFAARELNAGDRFKQDFEIAVAPKDRKVLHTFAHELERVMFADLWSWMRYLSLGLLWLLNSIHELIPNWGIAIVTLAVIMRVALLPVTLRAQRLQAKTLADQARLKPLLDEIKTRHQGDAESIHRETLKVYSDHGVSMLAPLAGCLWVLLQIPIFVALYFVINESFALRSAEFLWISDLSQADRLFDLGIQIPYFGSSFNVLPVLMAVSQMLASNTNPPATDDVEKGSSQQRILIGMALVFFVLLYNFPSGLMLYWLVSNVGQIVQQRLFDGRVKS